MQSLTDFFKGNPWLNILFLFLAIISIALAIIFYYKSLKDKKPVFTSQTFRLIDNTLSALKNIDIKYNNVAVKTLSLTKIAFWNAGKDTIKFSDIATNDPLLISVGKDLVIYDFEINYESKVNNLSVTRVDENSIKLTFEFLDTNDGVVINLYHNGRKSNDIKIGGKIIGSTSILYGIKRNLFSQKFDFITAPINFLINQKNVMLRILGFVLAMPIGVFIMIPLTFIILPLDFVNDRIINKTPRQFYFYDE